MPDLRGSLCTLDNHRRAALALDLVRLARLYGADGLEGSDINPSVIKTLKWVYSVDPSYAVHIAWQAFTEAAGYPEVSERAPLEELARCLRTSLAQTSEPLGKWSQEKAKGFVAAVLLNGD